MASLIGEINEGNVIVPGAVPLVTRLIAGTGITLTPASGTGDVTISDTTAGSGVQSVTGGLGINVGGTVTHPVVVNSGVRSLTAGSNISLGGTTNDPVINVNGVIASITAGNGVSVSAGANPTIANTGILTTTEGLGISITGGQNPTITNSGVRTLNAGSNISITGTSTDPVINATGVVNSVTGSSGITVSGTANNPILANNGVLSITAGTGVTLSGTAQNPIINAPNTGIASVNAGTGISVTTGANPTVSNTGLLSATAGSGISVSAGQSPTIANTGILSLTAGSGISITGGQNATISASSSPILPSAPVSYNIIVNGAGGTLFGAYTWGSLGGAINFASITGPNGAPFSNCKGILLRFYGDQAINGEPNVGWVSQYTGGGAGQQGLQYFLWSSAWAGAAPPPRSAFLYNLGYTSGWGWDPMQINFPSKTYTFPYALSPANSLQQYTDVIVYPNLTPEVYLGINFFSDSGGGNPQMDFSTSITNISVILHPLF